MPKKLTILGALTAALVFGYLGLFNSGNANGAGQTFAISPAAEAIDVVTCYDSNFLNSPQQAAPVPPALHGRVNCHASNPSPLPVGTAVSAWTVINLPIGNRLTLPTGFTPMGAGQWQPATVACGAVDINNECTAGTNTGDITSRTDIGCNTPTLDVLGVPGGSGGTLDGWANETNESEAKWPMPQFTRIAASVALGGNGQITGGDNAYVHEIAPFPASWSFRSSELAILTALYIGSGGSTTIPTSRLNLLAYESGYAGQSGLVASAALLGGNPDTPPNDSTVVCALQSPQDSISEATTLITPAAATRVVRWTTLQSDFDRADATGPSFEDDDLARILDWQCDVFGVPADGDDDGDCDPNATDTNDSNKDIDGDLVPDGVERAYASDPTDMDGDTDGDGCNDYCEIFQLTDPNDTDTDNDGQLDKPDDTSTNCVGGCAGDDAPTTGTDAVQTADDNCPTTANADQRNTDSMFQFHGMGVGTGDATNPDEDSDGDACDTDADNDGIPGTTESVMRIRSWTGYSGGATSVCVGVATTPNFATDIVMSDVLGDIDFDYVLDGEECIFRSRPDVALRGKVTAAGTVLNCSLAALPAPPLDGGCAQPGAASHSGGADTDADRLYMPGKPAEHGRIEAQRRTQQFNQKDGTALMDVDGDAAIGEADKDSDRDTLGTTGTASNLQDGPEVWIYGTFPADTDTDQDGCPDGDETADINGDGTSNSGDQGSLGSKLALSPLDNSPANGVIDDYATAMNWDINKDGFINSGDQAILGAALSAAGSCQVSGAFVEDNIDLTSLTKGLP